MAMASLAIPDPVVSLKTFPESEELKDVSCIDSYETSGGCCIVLSSEKVSVLRRKRVVSYLLLEDVLGVELTNIKGSTVELTVHGFPKAKKFFGGEARCRAKLTHRFDSQEVTENVRLAEEWKKKIIIQSRQTIQEKYDWYCTGVPPNADPRKYLVLINPAGGKGKAVSIYRTQILPLFKLAGIECSTTVTEYAGHAQSLVKYYDLTSIDGIIIASGDGLLYEVVNGLMERSDWASAITTPVGILPTGSGNALCSSLLYEAGEEYSIANAVLQIVCGGVSPMDVLTAHTTKGTKYFTLLFNWGIIADIDIESEKYRRLGEKRFTIGGIACIIKKKSHFGRLFYLRKDANPDISLPDVCDASQKVQEELSDHESKPMELFSSPDTTSHSTDKSQGIETRENNSTSNGPSTPLITDLSDPVPSNWDKIEGDFVNINFTTISHMARGLFTIKEARVGCGTIYLVYAKSADTSRLDLFKIMDGMAKGTYTEMSMMHVVEVKAFRIEPEDDQGLLTLDGEEVPYGPLQAQIHPQLGRVLGRRPKPQQTKL